MSFKFWTRAVRSSSRNGTSSSTNRDKRVDHLLHQRLHFAVGRLDVEQLLLDRSDLFLLRLHLLCELSIEALEALRIRHRLRVAARSILRAFADAVELLLALRRRLDRLGLAP